MYTVYIHIYIYIYIYIYLFYVYIYMCVYASKPKHAKAWEACDNGACFNRTCGGASSTRCLGPLFCDPRSNTRRSTSICIHVCSKAMQSCACLRHHVSKPKNLFMLCFGPRVASSAAQCQSKCHQYHLVAGNLPLDFASTRYPHKREGGQHVLADPWRVASWFFVDILRFRAFRGSHPDVS